MLNSYWFVITSSVLTFTVLMHGCFLYVLLYVFVPNKQSLVTTVTNTMWQITYGSSDWYQKLQYASVSVNHIVYRFYQQNPAKRRFGFDCGRSTWPLLSCLRTLLARFQISRVIWVSFPDHVMFCTLYWYDEPILIWVVQYLPCPPTLFRHTS